MSTAYHARMEAIGATEGIVALEDAPHLSEPGGDVRVPDREHIEIAFEDVTLSFADERRALDGISFSVAPVEAVVLADPSGAGKSMILNLLLGFVQPTSG